MEDVTLEQALKMLKYPRVLGNHKNKPINICKGKYGVYIKYNNKNVSLYGLKEEEITLEKVANIIDNGPTLRILIHQLILHQMVIVIQNPV